MTAFGTAPDADQEEQRHQRQLEEYVKEDNIERQEDADHPRFQQQKPGEIFVQALLDLR